MRQFNYVCSIVLAIVLPLTIVILSSNLILRSSAAYTFHFNDSQVVMEVPYNVKGNEFASEITSYWNGFFSDEPFQVYEDNGMFKDEIFEQDEQAVMEKAKDVLNIELAIGLFCLVLSVGIYGYLLKSGFYEALRNRYKVCIGVTAGLLVLQAVLCSIKGFRVWLYQTLIGLPLHKDSILQLILGDPSYVTYILFASIFGGGALAIVTYLHHTLTRPNRIFY
ncbi:MAG: DUF1461 domain-containing protein [Firmicutes bacterium]|nr:DUF1461 domain-containing protein [Bacillota bacterium]